MPDDPADRFRSSAGHSKDDGEAEELEGEPVSVLRGPYYEEMVRAAQSVDSGHRAASLHNADQMDATAEALPLASQEHATLEEAPTEEEETRGGAGVEDCKMQHASSDNGSEYFDAEHNSDSRGETDAAHNSVLAAHSAAQSATQSTERPMDQDPPSDEESDAEMASAAGAAGSSGPVAAGSTPLPHYEQPRSDPARCCDFPLALRLPSATAAPSLAKSTTILPSVATHVAIAPLAPEAALGLGSASHTTGGHTSAEHAAKDTAGRRESTASSAAALTSGLPKETESEREEKNKSQTSALPLQPFDMATMLPAPPVNMPVPAASYQPASSAVRHLAASAPPPREMDHVPGGTMPLRAAILASFDPRDDSDVCHLAEDDITLASVRAVLSKESDNWQKAGQKIVETMADKRVDARDWCRDGQSKVRVDQCWF